MSRDAFNRELDAARRRLAVLAQRSEGSADSPPVVSETLEELSAALEELRVAAEELQEQNTEAIGALAAGIAHDFSSLLSAMMGHAELAADAVPRGGQAWQELEEMLAAIRRGGDLVKQILTFSRPRAETRKLFPLHLVVTEALKLVRRTLPVSIEIREHLDPDSGTILGDAAHMHHVLMNLCANAAYAMREQGGVLEVSLEAVRVDAPFAADRPPLKPGPHLRLTVRDNGRGMESSIRERIFEPFFTTKRPEEGSGMGLAVVHGIVAGHGGAILVNSAPGQGSSFEVYLPRCDAALPTQVPVEEPRRGTGERILIVDDQPSVPFLWAKVLEQYGYRPIGCTDSCEALEMFRRTPDAFDLVITDLVMPRLSGDRLIRELLSLRPDLPIILCTGFSDELTDEKVKALGIRAFLIKPIGRRDLGLAVQRVLSRRTT